MRSRSLSWILVGRDFGQSVTHTSTAFAQIRIYVVLISTRLIVQKITIVRVTPCASHEGETLFFGNGKKREVLPETGRALRTVHYFLMHYLLVSTSLCRTLRVHRHCYAHVCHVAVFMYSSRRRTSRATPGIAKLRSGPWIHRSRTAGRGGKIYPTHLAIPGTSNVAYPFEEKTCIVYRCLIILRNVFGHRARNSGSESSITKFFYCMPPRNQQ